MSTDNLQKIVISNLRGSTQPFSLSFEKGKKLLMIYGENGTGKSTICDAFELFGKGKVGSIVNRGLGSGIEKYWPSIGKEPKDISVTLTTSLNSYQCTVNKKNAEIHPSCDSFRVEVLRRNQILSLVEAKAAERYNVICRFIDVSAIERSEFELQGLIKKKQSELNLVTARVDENLKAINSYWESVEKPGNTSLEWAENEIKKDRSNLELEINFLSSLQNTYSNLKDNLLKVPPIRKKIEDSEQSLSDAKSRINEIASNISKDASETIRILNAAKEYLDKFPRPEMCPLCESSEKVKILKTRIDERLSDFTALQLAQQDHEKASQEIIKLKQSLSDKLSEIKDCRDKLTRIINEKNTEDVQLPKDSIPFEFDELTNWIDSCARLLGDWKEAEKRRLGNKHFLETLDNALFLYQDNIVKQKSLDTLIPRLQKTLEIVQEARRKFTDEVLSKIAVEVGRIYEIVHPGEGLNEISIKLDPKQRASLNIGTNFHGNDTPPQAYFSESHLDTLGLCIFLALSGLDKPEETILVLDDVLASVDEPHVDRVIGMLYEESTKFKHCVITTHYKPWKEKFRWGWMKNGQCQFIELSKWTNDEGMTLIRSIPDIDRLRVLLAENPPDPQLVCAKAGVILEAILDFLTLIYQCKVPRKPNNQYTLGDLLPSIDKKLRKSMRVEIINKDNDGNEYQGIELSEVFDELQRIAQARNVFGCHFNQLSQHLPDVDALTFGQKVLSLADALIDPDAGWPKNDKSGSYWSNSGDTRRLHPLKKPE